MSHLPSTASIGEIVATIEREGGVIVDSLLAADRVSQVREELAPYLAATAHGRDEFGGFQTRRVGALMARSPACRELALDSLVNGACGSYLRPYCDNYQLHFTQAVSIGPGEGRQALHRDRGVWGRYLNRSIETQFSTIWAITDFSAENGATRIVPGSHVWDKGREPEPGEICCAEMKAGSVLLYNGTVLHGGGSNQTQENRIGVLLHYTLGWLRQEENQYLSCPPERAKELSPELRSLMGYSKGGYVLGFFSAPVGPGEGRELTSPESLFEDSSRKQERAQSAREVIEASS